jgi:hypothetical protein
VPSNRLDRCHEKLSATVVTDSDTAAGFREVGAFGPDSLGNKGSVPPSLPSRHAFVSEYITRRNVTYQVKKEPFHETFNVFPANNFLVLRIAS